MIGGCCGSPMPINMECFHPPIEQSVQAIRFQVKGHTKKALKLLIKQYKIDSIIQYSHDPSSNLGFKVKEQPMFIQYYDPYNPEKMFEWRIEPNEFKIY